MAGQVAGRGQGGYLVWSGQGMGQVPGRGRGGYLPFSPMLNSAPWKFSLVPPQEFLLEEQVCKGREVCTKKATGQMVARRASTGSQGRGGPKLLYMCICVFVYPATVT